MSRTAPGPIIQAAQAALQMPLPTDMRQSIREALSEYRAARDLDYHEARSRVVSKLTSIFDEWGYEAA